MTEWAKKEQDKMNPDCMSETEHMNHWIELMNEWMNPQKKE